ncbi:MAG: flagellar biosynthesis protein FlhF [Ignavibacteriae bacterium HGW-Ignavibacteriae-3]|nr:MAG: flagellar biosynthesis protein FlhF [Ignavibacteriae bacterium HGW-Ignavibacteriae-3]
MQIKKYIAPTLKEATVQMKNELGEEAIILGTRVLESDKRYNMKKMYEITAGVDQPSKPSPSNGTASNKSGSNNYESELDALTKKIFSTNDSRTGTEEKKNKNYRASSSVKTFDKEISEIAETLQMHEVQKSIVTNLVTHLSNSSGFVDESGLQNYLLSSMASMIPTTNFKVSKRKTHKIALVGPTGVGKTTCIAKLAVISKIIHKLNVGLISIDTYRLGAIDQLRIFSEISDIEMAVAYEPEEIPSLIKKFKDKDLIFIDTVGRSQKSRKSLESIEKHLQAAQVDETVLVVSATSSTRTLNDVAEKFKNTKYSSVIFSKVDEAVSYGGIMNLAVTHNIPVMFLTNGQVIPDDIVSVNPSFLANLVFTGKLYK